MCALASCADAKGESDTHVERCVRLHVCKLQRCCHIMLCFEVGDGSATRVTSGSSSDSKRMDVEDGAKTEGVRGKAGSIDASTPPSAGVRPPSSFSTLSSPFAEGDNDDR